MKTNSVYLTERGQIVDTKASAEAPVKVWTGPGMWLRLEGAVLLLGSATAYFALGGSWLLFALLLLVPDVAMLGYAANKQIGAYVYNLAHSTPLPAALLALGWLIPAPLVVSVALIWFAHIGIDRAVGYGLKYSSGFKDTHLGRI